MKSFLRVAGRLAGVAALTMFLAVVARAQNDTITPDPYEKSKEAVYLTPQADHALLYVARPEYVRFIGLSPFKVFVDDKAAGWLPQRSYLAVQVEPGRRLLWGPGRNEAQRFDFEAGKTYLLVLAEKYRLVNTGRSSVRQLDATSWIVRGPAEIKNMVSADKLEYVTTSDDAMAELNKESAKKYVKTNDKAQDPLEIALPLRFEKVMYRHAKKDFSLKTWEDTGVLTIGRESIEFKGAKMTVVIPMKDLQWFTYDTIVSKTVGLIFANQAVGEAQWNILSFMSEGQEQTIAFKDGRHLSNGADTKLIYKALQTAAPEKAQSSAKAAAAVAALADNSQQPNATAETQPSVPAPAQEASAGSQPAPSSGSQPGEVAPSAPAATSPEQTPAVQASAPRRGTLASDVLQRDTFRTVSLIDNASSDCTARRRVLKTEVTREPAGVKFKHNRMVAGSWEERWTIDRCGTPVPYDILFSSDGHGGTNIATKLMPDTAQEKKTDTAPPSQAVPAATPVLAPPLSPSAAAGTLPEGFVLFEGNKEQFIIAIPKDWTVYDQAHMLKALGTPRSRNGMFDVVIFYRSSDPAPQDEMSVEAMQKIETGEAPSFFVQKAPAGKDMSCGGFSEKAAKQVVKLVGSDSPFSRGTTVMEAPHAEPSPVAGCKGIRIRGSGQAAGASATTKEDVYAASDGVVLYLFSLRNPADKFDQNNEVFQKAVATARLSAAK